MLLPDDLIINKNCTKEMINLHNKNNFSIIATKTVSKKTVSRWGILKIKNKRKNHFRITEVIEKPSIKIAPSNYAVIGRYILPYEIFKILKKQKRGNDGEIHITDAIQKLILQKKKFIGHIFSGKYLDCGTMKGYVNSGLEISRL